MAGLSQQEKSLSCSSQTKGKSKLVWISEKHLHLKITKTKKLYFETILNLEINHQNSTKNTHIAFTQKLCWSFSKYPNDFFYSKKIQSRSLTVFPICLCLLQCKTVPRSFLKFQNHFRVNCGCEALHSCMFQYVFPKTRPLTSITTIILLQSGTVPLSLSLSFLTVLKSRNFLFSRRPGLPSIQVHLMFPHDQTQAMHSWQEDL